MPQIEVSRIETEPMSSTFRVRVADDDGSTSEHDVTLSNVDRKRLGGPYPSAEDFIRACFVFLLAREPKESILRSFDVGLISTYFPEFEQEINRQDGAE